MKLKILLSMLFFTKIIFADGLLRLTESEKLTLNNEFSSRINPIMARFHDGDVVGNGGGLLEQNFTLAYYSLQVAIENCLSSDECYTTEPMRRILKEINKIFIEKSANEFPLIFIKNSETNNFFYDEFDKTERIAKTGFDKKFPVFINLDMTTDITNDIPAMLSIIIHELGHQAGILSHTFLDQLGSKIRQMWISNWIVSDVIVGSKKLSVRLFSSKSNYVNSNVSYVFNDKVKSLNALVLSKVSCNDNQKSNRFSLSNGHWQRPVESYSRTIVKKTFWLDLYCEDDYHGYLIQKDIVFSYTFDTSEIESPVLLNVKADVH